MSWPHRDDGTVDWETVFEDEDIGLIAFIERAKTTQALEQCAHVIIQSLFIRDQDAPYRAAFDKAIDELAASNDDHTRDKILRLMREIKANRIERVKRYLEKGDHDEDRRNAKDVPTAPLQTLQDE